MTVVGAEDQIAELPARHRLPVGAWGQGSGERNGDRSRAMRAGRIAGHAVEAAVKLALAGRGRRDRHRARRTSTRCTSPAFPIPGHTEWLAHLAGDVDVAMMLAAEELRVVLVTTHVPFRDVPALLTQERVLRTGRTTRARPPRVVGHSGSPGSRSAR